MLVRSTPIRLTCLVLLLCCCWSLSLATAPPLREQISLNGLWDGGVAVPQYAGIAQFDQQVFSRTVTIPAAWRGQRIRIEFGAVNFIADVFVNNRLVMSHVGGWNPFVADIINRVRPGESFTLKVTVKGPTHFPIIDSTGGFQWPVGGWPNRGGIADDVWLRAYGEVYIDNAFIKTNVRQQKLDVTYRIVNGSTQPKTVQINGLIRRDGSAATVVTVTSPPISLSAGETKTVNTSDDWPDPDLWWPDQPALYQLESRVMSDKKTVDTETRRFGFREFWIVGNQYYLNGVRTNLFGDYQTFGDSFYTSPDLYTPENWPATVDKIKAMNIRVLRFHHNPVPQYVLDVTDEKGLLICDESANYARAFHRKTNHAAYLKNGKAWLIPWIEADRNHPSVYMWNAANEMTYGFAGSFTPLELREFGAVIDSLDPTRPVGYDGDGDIGAALDYHYPEGYNQEPAGSIYSWAALVHPAKPTGAGEILHTRSPVAEARLSVERNTWWLGIWLRGLRYTNWTNVKPACFWFTQADLYSPDSLQRTRSLNLRNAYAPVALFDIDYDDLGISPFVTGTTPGGVLPVVQPGVVLRRSLVVYNDEFRDTTVSVTVQIKSGNNLYAEGTKTVTVPLGDHKTITCSFQVPFGITRLDMVLSTAKTGQKKFAETRSFTVQGQYPIRAKTSAEVMLSEGYMTDFRADRKYRVREVKDNEN